MHTYWVGIIAGDGGEVSVEAWPIELIDVESKRYGVILDADSTYEAIQSALMRKMIGEWMYDVDRFSEDHALTRRLLRAYNVDTADAIDRMRAEYYAEKQRGGGVG